MPEVDAEVRFSIVVPAFNEEAYLGDTLRSLQAQDFPEPYEIIVVDNNSTDDTARVAELLGVTVLSEATPGVCAARQRGTAAARGQVVVSTDADTVHPPQWLRRIDAEFRRADGVVMVAGPCRYVNPSWWAALYPKLLFGAVARIYALTGRLLYVTATNVAVARASFPGYNVTLTQGGDELDLLRRMRGRGRLVWVADNMVDTSARRLRRGLLYTVFVSLLVQYLITYGVNRLASRPVLGVAPAFRHEVPRRSGRRRNPVFLVSIALTILLAGLFGRSLGAAAIAHVSALMSRW